MSSKSPSSHQTHILFILDHFYPYVGGGEVLFWELTRGLVKDGNKVTVITSRFDSALKKHETIEGVKVVRVGKGRIDFQRKGALSAILYCRKNCIDIVHGTSFFGLIPSFIVKLFTHLPVVVTIHEVYGRLWFQFLGRMGIINYIYEWFCLNILSFDRYICVSNYTKNSLRLMYGISDDKLITVYNGIDYNFWNPSHIDEDHINALKKKYNLNDSYIGLYFGRMGIAKGMDDVLYALPFIVKNIPHYKQIFITPKKQSSQIFGMKNTFSIEEIEKVIKKNNLQDNIIWIESVSREQLRDWIGLSDVVILPSRTEGFGFAVSEVCALGKNLVTTNIASIPEVVSGKVKFVEPGDSKGIAEKVTNRTQENISMVAKKKFSWNNCVDGIVSVYEKNLMLSK